MCVKLYSVTMLVGYSSSSSDEEREERDERAKKPRQSQEESYRHPSKKTKLEAQSPKARLPVPGCLLAMFPDKVDPETEDSSLHDGRIRSFKHERGNWATYVYFPYQAHEDFLELLDELLLALRAHGLILTPQEAFHLSLSQTVVLRHHWIQPFTQSIKAGVTHCKRFTCSAGVLKVYSNPERTRTFLGMEVSTGHSELLEVMRAVDRTMKEFHLDSFYEHPSFHVSLAWCVGDVAEQLKQCLPELQSHIDDHDDGPFLLMLDCEELNCRTGNKTFRFPLK